MEQQFFVGDKVKLNQLGVEEGNESVRESTHDGWSRKFISMLKHQDIAKVSKSPAPNDYVVWLENNSFFVSKDHLKVVERQWQKNTGKQPVDDDVLVEYHYASDVCLVDPTAMLARDVDWGDVDSITEWRIADSIPSDEGQPEVIPPSHVALGDNLAFLGSSPIEQDKKHSHYFKKCGYDYVDVYRTIKMFDVTDPCLQHAVKKLLVTGGRGFKDIDHDIQDVIDTLVRWQEMRKEDDELCK